MLKYGMKNQVKKLQLCVTNPNYVNLIKVFNLLCVINSNSRESVSGYSS